jgi:hypothetical protein
MEVSRQNFSLAKHYKSVIFTYSSKEVRPRLVTAAEMKWMKWIGRSLVERAAATTFTRPAQTLCSAATESPPSSPPAIRHPTLRGYEKNSSSFLRVSIHGRLGEKRRQVAALQGAAREIQIRRSPTSDLIRVHPATRG